MSAELQFNSKLVRKAASRAVNRAGASGISTANKEIRKEYNIKLKYLKGHTHLVISRPSDINPTAVLKAKGKEFIAVKYFNPKQTREGIVAKITKGQSTLFKGAFIVNGKRLNGVMMRKPGKGMRIELISPTTGKPYKSQFPLMNVYVPVGVPILYGKPSVVSPTSKKINERLRIEFNQQLSYLAKK